MCPTDEKQALVFGWTGAIGCEIVRALSASKTFDKIILIGRKTISSANLSLAPSPKFIQKVVDFQNISDTSIFENLENSVAFYAIGAESGIIFPDQHFYDIEYKLALKLAQILKNGGLAEFHWIGGMGTGVWSPFYFGRVKAQVVQKLGNLGFSKLCIYHPGVVVTKDGRGMAGAGFISVVKAMDHFTKWISVDGKKLGTFVVQNAENKIENSEEKQIKVFQNADINK